MMTAQQIALERAQVLAAVASTLRLAALQQGGELVGDAAALHRLGSGALWPLSATEMAADILPALARRPGHAGATVQPLSRGPHPLWHVLGEPLKPAALPPVRTMPTAAPAPVAPPVAAALAAPTDAEFERVRRAALAERGRSADAHLAERAANLRARQHADNLHFLRTKAPTP